MNHPQDVSPSSPARVPGLAAVFCGLAAGVLYACTAAFSLLPGLPSTAIASALGLGDNLVFENPLFAVLVRLFDRTPAGAAAGATALSVLCGAWCVFAVSWLVSRIRPAGSPLPSGDEEERGEEDEAGVERDAEAVEQGDQVEPPRAAARAVAFDADRREEEERAGEKPPERTGRDDPDGEGDRGEKAGHDGRERLRGADGARGVIPP